MTPETPPQGPSKDQTAGKGQQKAEGATSTPLQPGGAAAAVTDPAEKVDGDSRGDPIRDIAEALARAEAMKPVEAATADIHALDKEKTRKALEEAYAAAVAPGGILRLKFDQAHVSFDRAAKDMLDRLAEWVQLLSGNGAIRTILRERERIDTALEKLSAPNERARAEARAKAKRWAERHADWSSPVDKMLAAISQYADKIDKLNADINNDVNRDAQMLSFWFEVAPRHLQLSDQPLSTDAQRAVDKVKSALEAEFGAFAKKLERNAWNLYLLPATDLKAKRVAVLERWTAAAKAQAKKDAAFKLDPDDAASLKQRWDKVKDDAWIKDARTALEKPAA